MSKKSRLRLIVCILILMLGIFFLISIILNKREVGVPEFSNINLIRDNKGIKETIYFGKDNSFKYYDSDNNNILDNSCNTYTYYKYKNIIEINCKEEVLEYKVLNYKNNQLELKFNTGDVRIFNQEKEEE